MLIHFPVFSCHKPNLISTIAFDHPESRASALETKVFELVDPPELVSKFESEGQGQQNSLMDIGDLDDCGRLRVSRDVGQASRSQQRIRRPKKQGKRLGWFRVWKA